MKIDIFIENLVKKFPDLKEPYDEHIRDYDELLPHVFFSSFTFWLVSLYSGEIKNENAEALIKRILEFLEEAYVNNGEDVNNLIAVSFLENLPGPGEKNCRLDRLLGPAMAEQYKIIYG